MSALRSAAIGVVRASAFVLASWGISFAADFDFSPDQPGRPHAKLDSNAVAALAKGYKFVQDGVLTVAIVRLRLRSQPTPSMRRRSWAQTPTSPAWSPRVSASSSTCARSPGRIGRSAWRLANMTRWYRISASPRRKEKFDFSTYRLGLHGFFVRNDSSITAIREPRDAAGLVIITGSGTNQERILLEWNKRNVAPGLKPLEL
jgi:polar amino acid transport system substrate-binding protein